MSCVEIIAEIATKQHKVFREIVGEWLLSRAVTCGASHIDVSISAATNFVFIKQSVSLLPVHGITGTI